MHLVLGSEECSPYLAAELAQLGPRAGGSVGRLGSRLFSVEGDWVREAPPCLVFARQVLMDAVESSAGSISAWSQRLLEIIAGASWGEEQPWALHVEPCYGSGPAGVNRCQLIREGVRERLRRHHRRRLRAWRSSPEVFSEVHSLVQLLLIHPEGGFISVAAAPTPHRLRGLISPFPAGEVSAAVDKAAPSRAFSKLVEAEQRWGVRIGRGDTCVDLGAAPGSWTYVALQRGAQVLAIDRAPLRDDLMRHAGLTFHRGDAFAFVPDRPVDWLLCDVIAAPERSIELVLDWARRRLARRFVVTVKFKGDEDYGQLEKLKHSLPSLCGEFYLTRLCANKNEACVFGAVKMT